MGRRHLIAGLLAAVVMLACSCAGPQPVAVPQPAAGPHPWTDAPVRGGLDRFHFAVVADRTGGERPGVFDDGLSKVALLQPAFVMTVGDLIEGYTDDVAEIGRQREALMEKLGTLGMRVYLVPGNHDITNDVMADEWRTRFGPSYYGFVYRNVLFLCLNTEDPPRAHIGDKQAQYVARVLAEHPDVRWTFVFMHEPLWLEADGGAGTGWPAMAQALDGRAHTVIAGHYHHYIHSERGGQDHIAVSTTGGVNGLRGDQYGEFDHIVWVTMTESGPVIANLKLDGILPKDVVSEEMSDATAALTRGTYARSDGLVSEQQVLERAAGTLTLHNDLPWALTMRGEFAPHPSLTAEPSSFEATLTPGESKPLALKATAKQPADLTELDPLVLHLTAAYTPTGFDPITASSERLLSVHGTHEGREIAVNGAFEGTGEPWLPWVQDPQFGSVSIADGQVQVALTEPRYSWSAGVRQFDESMRPGGRYRLSLTAAGTGGRGTIHFLLKAGEEQKTVLLLIDGHWRSETLIRVGSEVARHTVEFTTPREVDLTKAKVCLNLGDLREARIDDVSLREIVGAPSAQPAVETKPLTP